MMRTTAFPAAITLEMLVDGRISKYGVLRQELAIPTENFMKELKARNIIFSLIN
jgi:saccharopine dehydrogenase-like NADP-dependent oxidoreductase